MAASSMSPISNSSTLPAFLRQSKSEVHTKFVDLEWQQRNRYLQATQTPPNSTTSTPSPFSRLSSDLVSARNRYMNVEPYAQNRVRLKVKEGVNDYINASPIQLGNRKYIATQGPKDTSVNHFYRMVAAEVKSPAVVVMLTQTHEAGKEKCFQYYPLSAEESPLQIPKDDEIEDGFRGEVVLESVEEDEKSRSQIRRLRLKTKVEEETGNGESQGSLKTEESDTEIHHLLFSGWPDFLIPEGDDRVALLELVRLSASLNAPSSPVIAGQSNGHSKTHDAAYDLSSTQQDNPRIIHCSAGVGRSGTFIALDYLLSLLYAGELDSLPPERDPIAETVDLLRQQRMMMVQGESQFNFLYEALRELMTARIEAQHTRGGAENAKMA